MQPLSQCEVCKDLVPTVHRTAFGNWLCADCFVHAMKPSGHECECCGGDENVLCAGSTGEWVCGNCRLSGIYLEPDGRRPNLLLKFRTEPELLRGYAALLKDARKIATRS